MYMYMMYDQLCTCTTYSNYILIIIIKKYYQLKNTPFPKYMYIIYYLLCRPAVARRTAAAAAEAAAATVTTVTIEFVC